MKKMLLLTMGILTIAGTAAAGCGSCESHDHETKKEAACEMKAAPEKAECATEKKCCGTCKGEEVKEKVECATEKAECAVEKKCCGTCKGEKKGSKWNPLNWFK